MNAFDRQRLLSALMLLVIALFVSAGVSADSRWRRRLRTAAVIGFGIALALALIQIGLWLAGRSS